MIKINIVAGLLLLFAVVLWQFGYLAVALRRFYLAEFKAVWGWLLATAAAIVLNLLNAAFITGVQIVGAALALWAL